MSFQTITASSGRNFTFFPESKTFIEAQRLCKASELVLAKIFNPGEIENITGTLEASSIGIWVGVTKQTLLNTNPNSFGFVDSIQDEREVSFLVNQTNLNAEDAESCAFIDETDNSNFKTDVCGNLKHVLCSERTSFPVQGNELTLFKELSNFPTARDTCQAINKTLWVPTNVDEFNEAIEYLQIQSYIDGQILLGLVRQDSTTEDGPSAFQFVENGVTASLKLFTLDKEKSESPWNQGEPNAFRDQEDCVELLVGEFLMNDVRCGALNNILCGQSLVLDIPNTETSTSATASLFFVLTGALAIYSFVLLATWMNLRTSLKEVKQRIALVTVEGDILQS